MSEMYEREPGERVLWRGRQWSVTTHALQCLSTHAEITFDRLADIEQRAKPDNYSWPEHMVQKNWIDLDDFIHCYLIACVANGFKIANIAAMIRRAQAKAAGELAAAKVAAELWPTDASLPADACLSDSDGFCKIQAARKDAEQAYWQQEESKMADEVQKVAEDY
jgi:hypothetical protein